ncbi:MAG: sensor histidine kinase [Candidatus Omnitrophota bacterium]
MTVVLILLLLSCVLLLGALLWQRHTLNTTTASYHQLLQSFEELDEQAKLIVRTDMELNRTQEELDKRLNGLDALQKISRLISTSLDKTEILHLLKKSPLTDLGFEKFFVLLFNTDDELECGTSYHCSPEEIAECLEMFRMQPEIIDSLKERQTISTISSSKEGQEFFADIFHTKHFVISPMMSQKHVIGVLIATSHSPTYAVTEGDEEIISILADQIGQSLENARLFEEAYRSSQSLEMKVQERTKQLSETLAHLKQISKAKSDFISAVSHELRTPLTSIKGYASILISGKVGDIPDKVRDRLQKINKHSDSLVQLINNLLDISRIESGGTEMRTRPQPISPVVEEVADLLAPQLKEKEITLVREISRDLPPAHFDTSQIERVLINLISNAVKFTPQGGTIKFSAQPKGSYAELAVADNGIGIKPDDVARLFNEFYRVENQINQNVKGTGLGLSLAKKIVEAHGGRMWVESEYGSGATFFFTVPIEEPAANRKP